MRVIFEEMKYPVVDLQVGFSILSVLTSLESAGQYTRTNRVRYQFGRFTLQRISKTPSIVEH